MQQLEQEIEQLNTEKTGIETALNSGTPVSYTHLDVYKRQPFV